MAKKKSQSLEMTPLMMLSVMAFFLMVPIVIGISNAKTNATISKAAEPQEVVVVSPTATPDMMDTTTK